MSSETLPRITVFASAFLLFLIEPIAAKQILPSLGGSSAVWMTCLVFFQLMLLFGYLYAHSITRRQGPRTPSRIHIVLLGAAIVLALLQLGFHPNLTKATQHPFAAVFVFLGETIGLPFLLLASTSPLLQVWLARRDHAAVKYPLFGLSNAGSLLALLLYPTCIEPYFTLSIQKLVWTIAFVLVAGLHVFMALQTGTSAKVGTADPGVGDDEVTARLSDLNSPKSTARQRWLWFLLPMAAAMQLSAVTGHLSQNIAAIPLLWILPLAVYLVTFITAFDAPALYRRLLIVRFLVILLAALGYMLTKTDFSLPISVSILFFLVELFFAAYFCHAEAHAIRPQRTAEATLFYLLIAAGGVAGSFFIGIASPMIFDANYDIALSFAATAAVALFVTWPSGGQPMQAVWAQRILWSVATVLLCVVLGMMHIAYTHNAIAEVRNFYGALRVRQGHWPPQSYTTRTFLNGTIEHGTQWFAPEFRKTPTTYYAEGSGIGLALKDCCRSADGLARPKRVGVIGLGAGTLTAYGQPGDKFTFYEINPAVEPIARNLFTYIRESAAQVNVIEGDARISLQNGPGQNYDVLAVDAFSGDAIPLHLLTREAMALYQRHLAPGGILAFHVSNQYLDLAPEIALLADSAGMTAALVQSPPDEHIGAFVSTWVLVTRRDAGSLGFFEQPELAYSAHPIHRQPGLRVWTDDYSSLLPILQWRGR
jgi:hypothetical protein